MDNCNFLFFFFFFTEDLEIFTVKIFSWFAKTTKIKKKARNIFCSKINHYGQHILHTRFHNAVSYSCFWEKGLSFQHSCSQLFCTKRPPSSIIADDSLQTFSVSDNRPCLLPQYTAFTGTFSQASSWLAAAWQARMQQAVPCFLTCVVRSMSFNQGTQNRICTIKNFRGCPTPRKIYFLTRYNKTQSLYGTTSISIFLCIILCAVIVHYTDS